jgi:hypothetical protein
MFGAHESHVFRLTTPLWRVSLVVVVLALVACGIRELRHARSAGTETAGARGVRKAAASVDLGPAAPSPLPIAKGAHRLLLDERALAHLRDSVRRGSQAWRYVSERCDDLTAKPAESGYQGFEWADAVASLALCWRATDEPRYGEAGTRYLTALLDDRYRIGDRKGGPTVVTHDSGYGIRTFAAYTALGYDWLREAPGMDGRLKARIGERLGQWLDWYGEKGYLRDHPIANYYWGYLTALSFSGLAGFGEIAAADGWLQRAREELKTRALPALGADLAGGGWPEGWQYGEYTALEIAFVAEAFRTGAGIPVAAKVPWLRDAVTHHMHALLPDGQSVYDGGTWGEHPAKPSALALSAASIALEGIDDQRATDARWMVAHSLPPLRHEQAWVGLLADRAEAPKVDPRSGAPLGLHLVGEGLTFARSDWSRGAVWTSFQAGPWLADDHQDKDQGHFELWRGSDALLVDGGDAEGSATSNHNSLLIDDGGRHMNYAPNQGVWGRTVRTTRFADDGEIVVAVGDIGEAYAPSCVEEGCSGRSVERMIRTFVYVRPSVLVIDDRMVLERGSYGATWAAHVTTPPVFDGDLASVVIGSSRVDVRTLEPRNAERTALREPTPSGEGPHRQNHPWGPMWRIEVRSPTGARERGFLHFISVASANARPPPSRALAGDGLRGAAGSIDGRRTVVLFAGPTGKGTVSLGGGAELAVIAGLEPGRHYKALVDASGGCTLQVGPSDERSDPVANAGGFLRLSATRCDAP